MRRLLWLGIGIGIGVVVVRTITRKAKAYTPSGLAHTAQESVGHLAGSVRGFMDELRDAMAEREDEIRTAFDEGVAIDEQPKLTWAAGVGEKFYQFEQRLMSDEQQEGEHRR
jgi:hypothetical protein